QKYAGGPKKHRFTKDIIILGQKATNKANTYGVYKACGDALGSQEAVDAYCNKTDNEEEQIPVSKRCKNTNLSDDDNTSDMTTDLSFEQKLKTDKIGVTLVFDEWKNVLKQHIFGSLLILSTGESLVWKTIDISSEQEQMIEIISKIESMINEISKIGTKLSAVVSDSVSAYFATTYELPLDTSACNSDDKLGQSPTHLDELYLPCDNEKVLAMSQIRASINFPQQRKQKPYNILLIPTIEPTNSQKEQMLAEEETVILEDEEAERENENNKYKMSSDLLSDYTYPAIDHNAKWKLRDLF
ncbi:34152_t:CDS:2, partial [Racocetra persica]